MPFGASLSITVGSSSARPLEVWRSDSPERPAKRLSTSGPTADDNDLASTGRLGPVPSHDAS